MHGTNVPDYKKKQAKKKKKTPGFQSMLDT